MTKEKNEVKTSLMEKLTKLDFTTFRERQKTKLLKMYREWLAGGQDYETPPTYATTGEWLGDWQLNDEIKHGIEQDCIGGLGTELANYLGIAPDSDEWEDHIDDISDWLVDSTLDYCDFPTGDETKAGVIRTADGELVSTDDWYEWCRKRCRRERNRDKRIRREENRRERERSKNTGVELVVVEP